MSRPYTLSEFPTHSIIGVNLVCNLYKAYLRWMWPVVTVLYCTYAHVWATMFLTLCSVNYVYPLVGNRKHPCWAQFIHLSKRRLFLLHIGVLHILFFVWKTAWTISGTGTITKYTFNESLCGKVMVGWVMGYGTRRRHRFRRMVGVTRYVNSLRYLSTDKLTQSDSVWLWSFTLCFPTDPGTEPGRK